MSEFWHWPDHVIGKRESRRLREEHNARMNERAELITSLESMLSIDDWHDEAIAPKATIERARTILAEAKKATP